MRLAAITLIYALSRLPDATLANVIARTEALLRCYGVTLTVSK